ncbi:hypothetical protein M885DRAFT_587386 [Pelagophyceae sp. CCMP2097]|nr:hypothetical protein M885DRAFT_587386 [Pelagophyceae sp. CCMP2097]
MATAAAKTRVAIYGGAFDPPTTDHMRLVAQILRSAHVDEVWLTPCGPRPDKPTLTTPTFDRWAMCHVAINSVFPPDLRVLVSDIDVHRAQAMFTHDMLKQLTLEHGDSHTFTFVVGTDWLQPGTNIHSWQSEEGVTGHILVQEFDFLVLPRPGFDVEGPLEQFGPRFRWLDVDAGFDMVEGNGSSTEVRKRLKASGDLNAAAGLVPLAILGYIKRQRLYLDD